MIVSLCITNFGPFQGMTKYKFGKGLNIIVGESATGKTQMIGAILYLYYGEKVIREHSKVENESTISIELMNGDTLYFLERKFDKTKKHWFSWKTNQCNELQTIISKNSKIISPVCVFEMHKENEITYSIDRILEFLKENELTEYTYTLLYEVILNIKSRSKNDLYRVHSAGEKYILYLLAIISQAIDDKLPLLLIDGFGSHINNRIAHEIVNLMRALEDKIQIIITLHPYNRNLFSESDNCITLQANDVAQGKINLGAKYHSTLLYPKTTNKPHKKHEIIQYVLNETVAMEENIDTEFKEVKGNSAVKSIISIVDQYIVAFLNSKSDKPGRILWGVSDDRIIKGVLLNYKDRDKLRRDISNKLSQISPPLPIPNYTILFHEVYNKNYNKVRDFFIIEVIIEPTYSKFFYATSKDDVFIKTDGGKRKLKVHDLQIEIEARRTSKNR